MGIRLWMKEKVAKLRTRKHDDDRPSNQQLHDVENRGQRGCSVLFTRALKHHNDQKAVRRDKARSRSNPETMSRSRRDSDDGSEWKPCTVCATKFQSTASKYLDFCSSECKSKAFVERKSQGDMQMRASEWI